MFLQMNETDNWFIHSCWIMRGEIHFSNTHQKRRWSLTALWGRGAMGDFSGSGAPSNAAAPKNLDSQIHPSVNPHIWRRSIARGSVLLHPQLKCVLNRRVPVRGSL